MKSKEKQKKSNLKSAIILLLLIAILLIASTYAWFTSNQTVQVSSLNVNVEAKNGLQISTDGTNWKSIIANADITGAHTTYGSSVNQVPGTLEPVSSAGNVDTTTGFMNMYYGVVDSTTGTPLLTATKDTEAEGTTGRFIAFDLFFKVDVDTPVYMTPDSKVTANGADQGLKNAARVAFLDEGYLAPGATTAAIQALKGATDSTAYIWEPNYDVHTASAVQAAHDTYGITTTAAGGTQIAYNGIKAPITTGVALNSTATASFSGVTPRYSTVAANASNVAFVTLHSGVTKIRTYMWVEGQDVDCENGASGTGITYDLKITSNNA